MKQCKTPSYRLGGKTSLVKIRLSMAGEFLLLHNQLQINSTKKFNLPPKPMGIM